MMSDAVFTDICTGKVTDWQWKVYGMEWITGLWQEIKSISNPTKLFDKNFKKSVDILKFIC